MASRIWWSMWVPVGLLACSGKTAVHGNDQPDCDGSTSCPPSSPACDPATKPADDGCNTCTCSGGAWACTNRACPPPACTTGATKLDVDGCNTCVCANGAWSCSKHLCPAPACTDGATKPAGDGCNTCTCSNGQWQCTLLGCELMCQEGDTKPAPDGCNTCICSGNQWLCTERACACSDGDTKQMDCNTCVCMNGSWACTKKACPPAKACGARAGDTCAADEYCAYQPGALCGAADAEATCNKRPQSCTTEYAPVCGCDGKTYSNQCAAAAAGTGINTLGACGVTP